MDKITQADEARALEIFNDALGDMCSFAEYGRPSYQDGALRTIAVHLASHRLSHTPQSVEPVATDVAALVDENERLRQALEDVANPLSMIQRQAEAEGSQLSGMAYSIANDLGFVQTIARRALAPFKGQTEQERQAWEAGR